MFRTHASPGRVALLAILALLGSLVLAAPAAAQNNTGSVIINKTDAQTDEPVADACFELWEDYPNGGPTYAAECTDANGQAFWEGVEAGEYDLVEAASPPGYAPVAPQEITVVSGDDNVFDVENTPTTVTVNKFDAETEAPLADACFIVTNRDEPSGDFESEEQCTDESGQTVFMYVPFGEYRVYETSPPPGYDFQEPAEVEVTPDDPHPVVNVPNFQATQPEGVLEVDKLDCVGADEPSMTVYENPVFPDEPEAPEGLHPCAIGHAVFEVTGGDLEAPIRLETNIFGFTLVQLPEGDYQIEEIEPNAIGPVPFSISFDDEFGGGYTIVVAINPLELGPGETVGPTPTPRAPAAPPAAGGGVPNTSSGSPVPAPWLAAVILVASAGLLGAMVIARRRHI